MLRRNELVSAVKSLLKEHGLEPYYLPAGNFSDDRSEISACQLEASKEIVETILRMQQK